MRATDSDDHRANRACYFAAIATSVGWFFIYNQFSPGYLCDEGGHLAAVYHYLERKSGWPEHVTMLPGYHFVVAALWQLHPPFSLLTLARLIALLTGLVALGAFASAWQKIHGRPAGRATLLLALLPVLQPFTGMAYSDVPAIAFVVAACTAHIVGARGFAAVLFVASACMRQTNLVWAGFVIMWEAWRIFGPRVGKGMFGDFAFWRAGLWELFGRTWRLGAVLILAVAVVAVAGRLTLGTQTGTALQTNIATLHTAALLLLLLGLPVWVTAAPGVLRSWLEAVRRSPLRVAAIAAGCLAAAAVLALTFRNPHSWNRDLFWPECTFTLLRNWPLVWIDTHPWLRVASGINVVVMSLALIATLARQSHRMELWLAVIFGATLPAANNLVEPRYFIPGFVFMLLFLEWNLIQWRRLAIWWALLCVVHAPFIAKGLSLW